MKTVPGRAVRPTADRVKEALFSMLASRFDMAGVRLLDLYAGSGALGIEALSRGAAHVVFVERDRSARCVLKGNLEACGFSDRAEVSALSARRALAGMECQGRRFDGALLDPPYRRGVLAQTLAELGRAGILPLGAWVVAERHVDEPLRETYGRLQLTRARRYGKTGLALYTIVSETDRIPAR